MDFGIWGGGGLEFHCQRPRNPLANFGRIHDKALGICLSLGPSDMVWIAVKPERLVSQFMA